VPREASAYRDVVVGGVVAHGISGLLECSVERATDSGYYDAALVAVKNVRRVPAKLLSSAAT
jgi:hypothetical protein